ncbi:hypothetical protein BKA80DRAFT_47764 [Phyllosticta citrichinensis]
MLPVVFSKDQDSGKDTPLQSRTTDSTGRTFERRWPGISTSLSSISERWIQPIACFGDASSQSGTVVAIRVQTRAHHSQWAERHHLFSLTSYSLANCLSLPLFFTFIINKTFALIPLSPLHFLVCCRHTRLVCAPSQPGVASHTQWLALTTLLQLSSFLPRLLPSSQPTGRRVTQSFPVSAGP